MIKNSIKDFSVKIFRNIFRIKLAMHLLFVFYNNLEPMGLQKPTGSQEIKAEKVKKQRHNQRLAELVEAQYQEMRRLEVSGQAKIQDEALTKIIKAELATGEDFYYGKNVQKDYKQALKHFENIFENSKTKNIDKALLLSAYHYVGLIYFFGDEKIKKDTAKALKIFNDIFIWVSAEAHNTLNIMLIYIDSVYRIGLLCYYEKKYEQAQKYFTIIMDIPNIQNIFPYVCLDIKRILGIMCFPGLGIKKNILGAELYFFDILKTFNAEKINPKAFNSAQIYLKIMYFNELDVVDELVAFHYKNIVNAIDTQKFNTIDWIKAHYFFVVSYWHGSNNITKNTTRALIHALAILAANDVQKIAPEIFLEVNDYFGRAYFYGDGVKQDDQRAKNIFKKIIDMQNSLAIDSSAYLDAKYFLDLLGEPDDMDSADWWREKLSENL